MPRRIGLILISMLLFFLFLEGIFIPNYNKYFPKILEETQVVREEVLKAKEEKLIASYNYDDYLDYSLEYSKVLFRDIYHLNKEITIYKGTEENIKKNNLVINQDGLVGIVTKVKKHSSQVALLTNEHTSMSVKVNESYGILKCKNQKLIVEGIDNKQEIHIGDKVTTSDLSIYPEQIFIGTVANITLDPYEIEQQLEIKSNVNFDNLSYLGILTELRGAE